MDVEISSGKIIKVAAGVLGLIIVIVIALLIKPSNKVKPSEVENIIFEKRSLSLTVGDTYQLKVIVSPSTATNKRITYVSSNNMVASVDEATGYVRANSTGVAKVTAISANGKQAQCTITVIEEKIPITSIMLDHDDIVLTEGESITLKVNVTPTNTTEHNYIWSSSDESVATVVDGKVTGLKAGDALITVKTESNKIAICDVEVHEKVTGIKIDVSKKTISVGDTLTINSTLEPLGTTAEISWRSSNPSVASVNGGVVKALSVGETIITAEAGGKIATAKIKVKIVSTSDIYTFKYDNNKPIIQCDSYTELDKIRLDDQLKRAVERVGYGTRAGVVEAARFFVGALDYKVPYRGTISDVGPVGRYPYVGLNIGKKTPNGPWGCKVEGASRQGIDCTNFVTWTFINGGIGKQSTMSSKNTYKSAEVVDKIRPGDLMYSPCRPNVKRCATQDYLHVGIVIGVDENKIYVAEARSESESGGTVVSEWDKNNMPTSGQFSIVRLFPYESDGKLTDMWD